MSIPVIDIQSLVADTDFKPSSPVVKQITSACKEDGFFYIQGHGIDTGIQDELERLSWQFFKQGIADKMKVAMDKGGKIWRGYFPVGGELTSGKPDIKEGLYFGQELTSDHPLVVSGTPLHGPNLFPEIPDFDSAVLNYMEALACLGHMLMKGIALSLDLPGDYFTRGYMQDPVTLFRIFHYPAPSLDQLTRGQWGVGKHTDYGVLTILKQDSAGGLQVYTKGKWIEAPFIENTFVCNLGDMLDFMTGGYYRSTPHRVSNQSGRNRLSFPFFFDLDYHAQVKPIDLSHLGHTRAQSFNRWDKADLQSFSGTYGAYLLQKVSRVFPQLRDDVL